MTEELMRLAERVETASEASHELNVAIWLAAVPGSTRRESRYINTATGRECVIDETREPSGRLIVVPAFTASLDAAMTLVPEAPWPWNVTMATAYGSASVMPCDGKSTGIHDKRGGHCRGAATPALALCAAALKARATLTKEPSA